MSQTISVIKTLPHNQVADALQWCKDRGVLLGSADMEDLDHSIQIWTDDKSTRTINLLFNFEAHEAHHATLFKLTW